MTKLERTRIKLLIRKLRTEHDRFVLKANNLDRAAYLKSLNGQDPGPTSAKAELNAQYAEMFMLAAVKLKVGVIDTHDAVRLGKGNEE
jgi:hypothetical protein